VVQLYVTQKNPSVLRPVKELKAFQKVFLKAGETQTIDLEIVAKDLAFYDETRHDWKLESDSYIIHSAASANDLKGRVEISLRD
jgi:beta-glucosidase